MSNICLERLSESAKASGLLAMSGGVILRDCVLAMRGACSKLFEVCEGSDICGAGEVSMRQLVFLVGPSLTSLASSSSLLKMRMSQPMFFPGGGRAF